MNKTKKYNYLYKITCTEGNLKGYYYLGKHSTNNLEDNYKGSGLLINNYYKKYPNGYIKEILAFFETIDDLNKNEINIISKHINDSLCLNIGSGGEGGDNFSNQSDNRKKEISNKISKSVTGIHNGMYGKKHSAEAKKRISEKHKGISLTTEHKQKISEKNKNNKHNLGNHHTTNIKKQISLNTVLRYMLFKNKIPISVTNRETNEDWLKHENLQKGGYATKGLNKKRQIIS